MQKLKAHIEKESQHKSSKKSKRSKEESILVSIKDIKPDELTSSLDDTFRSSKRSAEKIFKKGGVADSEVSTAKARDSIHLPRMTSPSLDMSDLSGAESLTALQIRNIFS